MAKARDTRKTASTSILGGVLLGAVLATPAAGGVSLPSYLGPDEYLSEEDSPFEPGAFGFCIEDFEDNELNVPGVTGNGGIVGPAGNIDSVDGDDGEIDGSGTNGRSYFSGNGAAGIEFEFDVARTNGLPTVVGIVWTDGGPSAPVTFEAFGPDNQSVLLTPYGPFVHADNSNNGQTAEDRFYGVTSSEGIRRIVITNTSGGIEVDHLQLNECILCGDADLDLSVEASDALFALRASVGSEDCLPCICDANGSADVTVADALAILKTSVGLPPAEDCPACGPIF